MNVAGQTRVSVCLVENCGDGSGDDGLLQPAFQPLRVLLGKNALAGSVGHRKAASPQDGQQGASGFLGTSLVEPLGTPLSAPLGTPLSAPLGAPLCDVLLREIALVFVAFHHRLQRARRAASFKELYT